MGEEIYYFTIYNLQFKTAQRVVILSFPVVILSTSTSLSVNSAKNRNEVELSEANLIEMFRFAQHDKRASAVGKW